MKFFSRQSRRTEATNQRTVKLRIDHLEDRLTPSAFGPVDGAYFVESWNGRYCDVKIQPGDQKIVASGRLSTGSTLSVARYDSVGNVDAAYGTNGRSDIQGIGTFQADLLLQSDGKAVVSAIKPSQISGSLYSFGASRLNLNGTLDTGFGNGGFAGASFGKYYQMSLGVGLQSNGKIVAGGWTADQNSLFNAENAILARFTSKGVLDSGRNGFGQVVRNQAIGYTSTAFGGQIAEFQRIAVQPDDKLIGIGVFSDASWTSAQLLVARYTANGILDTTFNGSGYSVFNLPGVTYTSVPNFIYSDYYKDSVALQSDGKIVVVTTAFTPGTGSDNSDILVVRYNTNGTLDTTFAGTGFVRLDIDGSASVSSEIGSDVAIQPDGKIVIAGSVSGSVLVTRLNSNGTQDTAFGNGGFKLSSPDIGQTFTTKGMALQSNGDIIVAGLENDGTNDFPMLARFYGTTNPLLAASPSSINTQTITLAQVQPLLTEAIARWQSAGFNVTSLNNINLRIADLPGTTLGQSQGNTITLDTNAAGWGWFVDKSPKSDSEFRLRGNQGEQGRIDLLTVLMHETGHVLGRSHSDHGLMAETLAAGTRQGIPLATDAAFLLRELSQLSKSHSSNWLWARVEV